MALLISHTIAGFEFSRVTATLHRPWFIRGSCWVVCGVHWCCRRFIYWTG